MRSLLQRIFIDNWLRKLISLVLSIIIWYMVHQSINSTRTIAAIPIRVLNLPEGKTVQGLMANGYFNKRINLTITGRKHLIEEISSGDLEVIIDISKEIPHLPNVVVGKQHLVSFNPNFQVDWHVTKVEPKSMVIKLLPLVEDLIPVHVTRPIGEAPKGFQFLEMWPYHLSLKVKGPEETIKRLKTQGVKLNFNLSSVSRQKLEEILSMKNKHVVSFFIPDEWKEVSIPELSDRPFRLTDRDADFLRIDFIRDRKTKIPFPIPVNIYVSPDYPLSINPTSLSIVNNQTISSIKGIKYLQTPIYATGVSKLFIKTVTNMITISVNFDIRSEKELTWSIQFINPVALEDRYVHSMIHEVCDEEIQNLQPRYREEYLRNRFRNYMNRIQFVKADGTPLDLQIEMKNKDIIIHEKNSG